MLWRPLFPLSRYYFCDFSSWSPHLNLILFQTLSIYPVPVDETARSDLDSEPGELVMDLSYESVSFSALGVISLLTVDYLQNCDKSYLGQEAPCDGPVLPRVRGCYVGLGKLPVLAPRSPSTSPPPVRVHRPLRFASESEVEEEPADLSSGDDSVLDPTVKPAQLSDSEEEEELEVTRKPVPLKVLEYSGQHSWYYELLFTSLILRSCAAPGCPSWLVVCPSLTWVPELSTSRY